MSSRNGNLPRCTFNVLGRVYFVGHGSQVVGVATALIAALVVKFQTFRDWPVLLLPDNPMDKGSSATIEHAAITSLVLVTAKHMARPNEVRPRALDFIENDDRRRVAEPSRRERCQRLPVPLLAVVRMTKP